MRFLFSLSGVLCATTMLTSAVYAQNPTTTSPTKLAPVVVTASPQSSKGSMTVPSNEEAEYMIKQTPGGVAVVTDEEIEDRYILNFEDTLALTPGVYAQKRYGEEVRLSIRGSGLSRGFHLRGLTLLQDGVPYNLADGGADFQQADPLSFQRLEVYKGANALQYGGTSLGGAINMVSKTGHSQPGDELRLEFGSDNTYRANVQSGRVWGDSDVFLSLTATSSEGYRQNDEQENLKFNANIGTSLTDDIETRFYVSGNVIEQELPGSISLSDALNNPETANPDSVASHWRRDIRSVRLANKTTISVGDDDQVDVGAFVNVKDLFHPITSFVGVVDQESEDYGVFAQGYGEYRLGEYRNVYRLGITSHFGETEAKLFENIRGSRGALKANADQEAGNVVLYGENSWYMMPELALVTGGQLIWSQRKVTDHVNPSESDSETYRSFNPKVGLLYEPYETMQFFTNVSRSFETPTFGELTQGGTVGFTPVDAQEAWTAEIGSRGTHGRYDWDVSLYHAWIDGEMLQFTRAPGIPAVTFNAEDTVHQGIEAGLGINVAESFLLEGDNLRWRHAYTYSHYHFDGDAQYGDNEIAGQPAHFYQTELRYSHDDGWHVAMDLEAASEADVDFANTLAAPGYGVLGFNAGYDITDGLSVYLDGRNMLDHRYVSTFSTLVNTAGNTSVFYPGEGRRVFAGMRIRL